MAKFTKRWDEIKYLIKTINGGKPGEYGKDFTKTKFNSDVGLSLNKLLRFHTLTRIARCVFEEDGNYYPQVFLDECLYEFQKFCNAIELMFHEELISIKQAHQKYAQFCIIGISEILVMNLNHTFVVVAMIY